MASMERSLAVYRDLLGVEPDFVAPGSGEELSRAVGVPATVLSFAFLRLGNTILELLEYEQPRGRPYDRRNCDIGAVHVCCEVEDIQAAYEAFSGKGVEFSSPPVAIGEGPLAGCSFAYFKDPDGVRLELFEVAREPA